MKIILREDVEKLGSAGEAVSVRDGYARNFLVPRGLAYVATVGALKKIEGEMKQRAKRIDRERVEIQATADKMSQVSITIEMKVGEEDRLYGSVTNQVIAERLGQQGYAVDRRSIILEEPIRTLGQHDVQVRMKHGVMGTVKVNVIAE